MKHLKDLLNTYLPASRRGWPRPLIARLSSNTTLPQNPLLRRQLLKGLVAGSVVLAGGRLLFRHEEPVIDETIVDSPRVQALLNTQAVIDEPVSEPAATADTTIVADTGDVKDYLYKMRNFNADHNGDRFLSTDELSLLRQVSAHLGKAQTMIGHANFNLLGFDQLRYYARNYSRIGSFSARELELMEQLFYTDARELGFFGDKVVDNLTLAIKKRDTIKIASSGNYLFRGKPELLLKKIQKQGGSDVILTSGIRGVVKQMHLFMDKTIASHGNLSLASRSLAPPGYSFHGISDFDVGQRGLGYKNFTADFAGSDVYKKLSDLGYLTMRYPLDNMLGVRYEPWHVKVG
jgi:hypothetical protein